MLDCPACAGPAALGGGCSTCNGTTEVTQEVCDAFIANQVIKNELHNLQTLISDVLFSVETNDELKQAIVEIIAN